VLQVNAALEEVVAHAALCYKQMALVSRNQLNRVAAEERQRWHDLYHGVEVSTQHFGAWRPAYPHMRLHVLLGQQLHVCVQRRVCADGYTCLPSSCVRHCLGAGCHTNRVNWQPPTSARLWFHAASSLQSKEAAKGRFWFFETDLKAGTAIRMDKTGKSILMLLRHLGRLQEVSEAAHTGCISVLRYHVSLAIGTDRAAVAAAPPVHPHSNSSWSQPVTKEGESTK
jgi:hypothetical protein